MKKATIIILGNKYTSNVYTAARSSYDIFGNYFQEGNAEEESEGMVKEKPQDDPSTVASASISRQPISKK